MAETDLERARPQRAQGMSVWRWGAIGTALLVSSVASAGPSTLSDAMLTFHDRLRAARDALVFADLESFRTWVGGLAGSAPSLDVFPEAQRRSVKQVRALAAQGQKAASLGEATVALGQLARQCGQCHARAGHGPEFPPESAAPEGPTFADHMERHRWALERLWEGLTAGREQAWQAGVNQLREPALTLKELPAEARNPQVADRAKEMHILGQRASKASAPAERAKLVGEIVETCGRCHAAAGVRGS